MCEMTSLWMDTLGRGNRVTMGAAVCGPMDTVVGAAVCGPTDTVGGIGSPWGLLYVVLWIL